MLVGTPDMVLEIVSSSSVRKATGTLHPLYWEARIPEYWLVDARSGEVEFTLFRYTKKGYGVARQQAGWLKSKVFGKAFQFRVGPDRFGGPSFTLRVR